MRRRAVAIALVCTSLVGCSAADAPEAPVAGSAQREPGATTPEAPPPSPSPSARTPATRTPTPAAPSASREPSIEPSGPFDTARLVLRPPDDGTGTAVEVDVWVADAPALRARGLMGREQLAPGTGMVFEFERDTTARFWMRDTLLPLSIAFVDEAGTILDIVDMDPCTTASCPRYGPELPYRRALEVPQGWFDEVGAAPGWLLEDAALR